MPPDSVASEADLAALLAETLADAAWWTKFAESPANGRWSKLMVARAVALYARTGPVIETRINEPKAEAIDRAVGVLREVADAAAMRSRRWTPAGGKEPRIPTRAVIELMIRLDDVDDWAAELGHPLDLPESGVPDEVWPLEDPPPELQPDDFISVWDSIAETFDVFVNAREDLSEYGEGEHRETLREVVCELIDGARSWVPWARGHLATDAEPLAVACLFMAQGMFVVAWEASDRAPVFPSVGFLREFLGGTGALDWLAEQGGAPPEWLT
jgi:hypothetical protein